MNTNLRNQLIEISRARQTTFDPSHDFQHILRVTNMAEQIAESIGADLDIVIAAALFHDTVVYPKNSPQSSSETDESAKVAAEILSKLPDFPQEKIEAVTALIKECSFRKGLAPSSVESQVLQDADRLEATGAVSIMRTFSSSGQMNRPFYDPSDPFCEQGAKEFSSSLELFYNRLLKVEAMMHTDFAKGIAKRRTSFLKDFLEEFRLELEETKVI